MALCYVIDFHTHDVNLFYITTDSINQYRRKLPDEYEIHVKTWLAIIEATSDIPTEW